MITSHLDRACGRRHGLVDPPVGVPASAADVGGFHHASVGLEEGRSGGGGTARTRRGAEVAAVAESLERWSAAFVEVDVRRASTLDPSRCIRLDQVTLHSPAQRADPAFPHRAAYPDDEPMVEVCDLRTNEARWVPAALVPLTGDHGALSTSSGLAADGSVVKALLRATEELIERDAYVTTWLHQLGGRHVADRTTAEAVAPWGGEVAVYDITPRFSSHPVAAVAGSVPMAGHPRPSIGLACRATWREAVDKALAELLQGTVFVAHHLFLHPELVGMASTEVTDFDRHATFYAANPDLWYQLPLHRHAVPAERPPDAPTAALSAAEQLRALVQDLTEAGFSLHYRELTSAACAQVGLRVVRVVAPELTPLHHDHRWPFLGGTASDLQRRYADGAARRGDRSFPSPHPHALG